MEPDKETQQELFDEFKEPHKARKFRLANLAYYPKGRVNINLSYEKAIFSLIGLILIMVIMFSLGVEKGKNLSRQIVALRQQKQLPVTTQQTVSAPQPIQKPYTIQVASLIQEDSAQKELIKLKSLGFEAFVVKGEKHYVVYVGAFSTKEEAQALLTKLKPTYKDCYIKKH